MKPVLVLQHLNDDGPAYLHTWLQAQAIPMDLRCTAAGDSFPEDLKEHGALAILGGSISANDDLPSLRRAEALVREGIAQGVPVIGHCLGGQLMARALGARVHASPAPEVGWLPITIEAHDTARHWFGDEEEVEVFQFHHEAFDLPAGAVALAGSAQCPHQAFAIGPHLAMQFHVELDVDKLTQWLAGLDPAYWKARARHPDSVQSPEAMRAAAQLRLVAQQGLADRLYRRWLGFAL